MKKTTISITETFQSPSGRERWESLQRAIDLYLELMLKSVAPEEARP